MIHTRILTGKMLSERDPARRPFIDVALPMGYRRVWSGAVKRGDRFIDMGAIEEGEIAWIELLDLGEVADDYPCLIRPDQHPVEEPCERCKAQVRNERERFCGECRGILEEKGRPV